MKKQHIMCSMALRQDLKWVESDLLRKVSLTVGSNKVDSEGVFKLVCSCLVRLVILLGALDAASDAARSVLVLLSTIFIFKLTTNNVRIE